MKCKLIGQKRSKRCKIEMKFNFKSPVNNNFTSEVIISLTCDNVKRFAFKQP